MSSPIQTAFNSWSPPTFTIAVLLTTAALYARGFSRLHREMPHRFPIARLVSFAGGIAALLLAIASPLEELDDLLLQVHMMQHLILMIIAPTLLIAGAPEIPLVRGLPPRIAKVVLRPIRRSTTMRQGFRWITHPAVCWITFSLAMWGWHLPPTFQLALRSNRWHVVEHACFFTSGLMFWYPVVQPWPSVSRWPRWAILPYLVLADGQNTILSALLVFSGRLLYPYYAMAPSIPGFTPLGDQVVAGVIMWVPGSILYLVPAAMIVFQMLAPQNLSEHSAVGGNAWHPAVRKPSSRRILWRFGSLLVALSVSVALHGCAGFEDRPELNPDQWAPTRGTREWTAPPAVDKQFVAPFATDSKASITVRTANEYDLPGVVDIALNNNPETQRAWSTARSAAANLGAAQAPYYPQVGLSSDNGYLRTNVQLPATAGLLRQWSADPTLAMNWTLLDFGRRKSASDSARDRLIAANFAFNRTIQDVVFKTESSFYAFDAADGAVIVAQKNFELAETDFDAVSQRVDLGLATEPQLL